MKPTIPLALALAATASAQDYNETSRPFQLVLSSSNKTIDGQKLAACHTGAAIESLCLTGSYLGAGSRPLPPVAFHFNTSASTVTGNETLGKPGILTYDLPATPLIPSSVTFFYDPTADTALPLLEPGSADAQLLAFDKNNRLNVQGYIDQLANPPVQFDDAPRAFYRWYACRSYFLGYSYNTLVWGLGRAKPENPSCVKVDVKRVFV
jgi:hypothetical protein